MSLIQNAYKVQEMSKQKCCTYVFVFSNDVIGQKFKINDYSRWEKNYYCSKQKRKMSLWFAPLLFSECCTKYIPHL